MAQDAIYARDHNINTGEGSFNVNNIGRDLVQNITTTNPCSHLGRLHDAIAGVGASHTSKQQFARGRCLEGTREEAIGDIHKWRSSSDPSLPICWLFGTAGVGKTAIAMTVAQACENDGLVASFFFFRSDPKRNNPDALAPTIALGLVTQIPSLRTFIDQQISQNPTILEAHLEDQLRELVVKPSLQMERPGELVQKVPNLVILDGLDECGDEDTQTYILSTILSSYQQLPGSTWLPLKFLICSRPEAWVQEAFEEDLRQLTQHIALNNASQTDRDIERYFLYEFEAIRTSRKFARFQFPSPWPSNMELGQLVRKSSSQFVFATTAVKFVKTPYSNPLDQLHTILDYNRKNQNHDSPFSELDHLYYIILSANPNREKLLSALAVIFICPPYLTPSPEDIEFILDWTPGEVDLTLRAMHSVLDIQGSGVEIRVFHTSFKEYLFDRTRAGIFFIDEATQGVFLGRRWLQALSTERLRQYTLDRLTDFEWEPKAAGVFSGWIGYCSHRLQAEDLIEDLQNVELGTIFLSQLDLENNMTRYYAWNEVFAAHFRSKPRAMELIERYTKRPSCFHLEWTSEPPGTTLVSVLIDWAILKITGFPWHFRPFVSEPGAFRTLRSNSMRLTDCRCGVLRAAGSTSPHPAHQRYQVACLRTLKTLVGEYTSEATWTSHRSNFAGFLQPKVEDAIKALADSSLLEHCGLEPEVLAQCNTLFSLPRNCPLKMPLAESQRLRKKLVDWLETCPASCASEAEGLRSQVTSLFAIA
ncbi:hypothetical protein AAF712_013019 [Marasmius tenuissimus]|uniref:Nephrocystin 3-like N-terminal domain-containing protein n=1 Tax=Marasmius tenuissimus TaxID=585030 RepID=A0ABR2ZG18_9AGAR